MTAMVISLNNGFFISLVANHIKMMKTNKLTVKTVVNEVQNLFRFEQKKGEKMPPSSSVVVPCSQCLWFT